MANKRMFNNTVLDSDAFLDLPLSTQALYFHLNLRADDDGFISNPKRIQTYIGASEDDLKLLVLKRFVIAFEDGVIVIKHWRMHNTIQKDRYHPTVFQEEFKMLGIKDNKAYTLDVSKMETSCIQTVSSDLGLGLGLDKDLGIDKDLDKRKKKKKNNLTTLDEVLADFKDKAILDSNEELQNIIIKWLGYKNERKDYLTETGIETLLNKFIEMEKSYGIEAVLDCVNNSISNNYQGIVWDRIKKTNNNATQSSTGNAFLDKWASV